MMLVEIVVGAGTNRDLVAPAARSCARSTNCRCR